MKCPGQDRAYWKGDRAYEIPCPRCGSTVEFFRDEDSRRCHQCGFRFRNPRLALDCASWCDQAEACMGISRSGSVAPRQPEAAFLGRLIEALEVELSEEPVTFARALLVFQHAKELVPTAQVDPRSVLPAALLLDIDRREAAVLDRTAAQPGGKEAASRMERILSTAGLDEQAIRTIRSLVDAYRNRTKPDAIELAILSDASRLASFAKSGAVSHDRLASILDEEFATEAGKHRAQSLFRGISGQAD